LQRGFGLLQFPPETILVSLGIGEPQPNLRGTITLDDELAQAFELVA